MPNERFLPCERPPYFSVGVPDEIGQSDIVSGFFVYGLMAAPLRISIQINYRVFSTSH